MSACPVLTLIDEPPPPPGEGVLRGKKDKDDRWKSQKTTLKNTKQ